MYSHNNSFGTWVWAIVLVVFGTIGVVASVNSNAERSNTVTDSETIPYATIYVEDPELEAGKTVIHTQGVSGHRTVSYKVKTKGGKEISREMIDSVITQEPVDQVVAKGVKPTWHCQDTTSYNRNPYDDNYCEYSDGTGRYVADSEAEQLDPSYTPGKAGAAYYNNF